MIHCPPTEVGLKSPAMAGAGNRPSQWWTLAGGLIVIEAAGFTPTAAGIGCQIIPGAGRRSIMAAGTTMPTLVGSGRRTPVGVLLGLAGAWPVTIAAGRRCRPKRATGPVLGSLISTPMWDLVSTS